MRLYLKQLVIFEVIIHTPQIQETELHMFKI